IRSTVLGDALARIASFLGHEIIRDNHIGDWGTQFGMVIYGWKNLLDRAALERDPIAELVRIYKETNEKATSDPKVREAVREELVKLQAGDAENFAIWKGTVDLSMKEFEHAYQLLDVHYDIQRGESFYNARLPNVVERLLKSGIAEISEGAVCVFFRDIPELADKPCIIRKRGGGYNYATTDVATVDYRINDLKADTIWIVTGAPQILHFKQIFEIARREGYKADLRHITHGSILGQDVVAPGKYRAVFAKRLRADSVDLSQSWRDTNKDRPVGSRRGSGDQPREAPLPICGSRPAGAE